MNTKLTLRLDQRLIRRAKTHARRTGKSVSQVVADYFTLLGAGPDKEDPELTPIVRSLKGVLRGRSTDRAAYRKHMEEKYL
jgi:replicative DNA helicase